MPKTCPWVMGGVGSASCGERCRRHWTVDEDLCRVREWDPFCPEHMVPWRELQAKDNTEEV